MIQAQRIYLIGIGGIGMSALARIFLSMGSQVGGSDLRQSAITDELARLGVKVFIGHNPKQFKDMDPELVIYSADITIDAPGYVELRSVQELKMPLLTYAQAIGELMKQKFGVAVTGTNGKSTTTAMLALMLEAAGYDPMVVLGTQLSAKNESEKFKSNARFGEGKYFVVEADEYQRKMLETDPKLIVLTNIAEDHLDYYRDLADIKQAFRDYVNSLPEDGVLIFNADDHNTVEVGREATCHKFTFGIHHYADLQAMNIKNEDGRQTFDLFFKDEHLGRFELQILGLFNISNALGASLAALKLDVRSETIKKVLASFSGTWRRFENLGSRAGVQIISDYGHHPAGISATLQGVKSFYPDKRVLLVFQPHHRNRTKKLFGEFVEALRNAEEVILPEIFEVAGREHGESVSSKDLSIELEKLGTKATYAKNLSEAEAMIKSRIKDFDVVILMGAGDIDGLARKLVNSPS